MLDAALAYAARGWPVFPCNPRTKQPLTDKGLHAATTDRFMIESWWSRNPTAMIGVPTGAPIGAFVLDVDAGADAKTGEIFEREALLQSIEAVTGPLPGTLATDTPRGGAHLFFRMPEGLAIGNRAGVLPRVDVRGTGGYVIVAPSRRNDGATYVSNDLPPAAAWPALLELVTGPRRGADGAPLRRAAPAAAPGGPAAGEVDAVVRKYALAALDAELQAVARAGRGMRNDSLNQAAFVLGQLVGAGALGEGVVRAGLVEAAAASGLAADDGPASVEATIDSGLKAGRAAPRDLGELRARGSRPRGGAGLRPEPPPPDAAPGRDRAPDPLSTVESGPSSLPGGSGGGRGSRGGGGADLDRALAFFPQTDLGNAERFFARHGERFRWCREIGWFAWSGKRWECFSGDALPPPVAEAVYATVRAILDEAALVKASGFASEDNPHGLDQLIVLSEKKTTTKAELLHKWGRSSESASRLACIAALARPWLTVTADAFDRDPFAINVANGTLRVGRAGEGCSDPVVTFGAHDPADLITKISPAAYVPEARCPVYDATLARVQPDERMRRFIHAWDGLSLTGDTGQQKLVFHYGTGRNGKGTIVEAHAHVAGDYATSVGIETFLDQGAVRKGADATPDLAKLPGVRMLRTSEPEKGTKLAEALIKRVTGGDPITARHLNRDFFTFHPIFKLSVQGNYRPKIDGTDEGIWGRLLLVPWTQFIPDDERDRELPAKLKAEASGILNRLLDGLLDYLANGLPTPDQVREATQEYRAHSDPLGRFLALCVAGRPGARVQSSKLHALFNAWAKASGEREWTPKGFSGAMVERGYRKMHSNTVQWLDIEMLKSPSDFVDPPAGQSWSGPDPPWEGEGEG